jgi:hypothetical protein
MRKILLLLLPFTLMLTSCDLFNNYGKKVEMGGNEVYYKGDGVTEAEAKKLGEYLKEQKYFNDSSKKSVQLLKEGSDYVVKLVVDKDKVDLKNEPLMNQYWAMQILFSENVFNNAKTKVVLADTKLKDIHTMDAVTKITSGNFFIYLKGNGVSEDQAKKAASLIEERKYFGNAQAAIMMEKKNDAYVLNFVYNQQYYEQNKQNLLPIFKMIQWLTSEEAFNNAKTQVNLTNGLFASYENVGEFTKDEKNYLLQQSQQSNPYNDQTDPNTQYATDEEVTVTGDDDQY